MKTLTSTLLAAALCAGFANAADSTSDPAAFRKMNDKAAADYKAAVAECKNKSGNAKDICIDEAKVARARTEYDAVVQHQDTQKLRIKYRARLADAEYALAKERCDDMSGADKENCSNMAKSVHTAALSDAKADRPLATTEPAATSTTGTIASRTEAAAETAVQKTKDAAAAVSDKTERAVDKTGTVVADSVITTKVKADIFKEPELKTMAIHVETDKGVVMLSGFVDSKADAEKAANIARKVEGVTQVKSAIKVK